MNLKHILFACCLITFNACKKEDPGQIQVLEGSLRWTGDPASDGCGYILTINENSRAYKPTNDADIPSSYKTGEPVSVVVNAINYNKTIRACMTGTEFNQIKVLEVGRR